MGEECHLASHLNSIHSIASFQVGKSSFVINELSVRHTIPANAENKRLSNGRERERDEETEIERES